MNDTAADTTATQGPGRAADDDAGRGGDGATIPTPPPAQQAAAGPRRLYRSRDDRMVAGVCGGLAEYLRVDPTVVRLVVVASLFLPGPQVIAYLAAWLLIPERPTTPASLSPGR